MPVKKLPSEINTPTMKKRILAAARKRFHTRSPKLQAFYEHGHWWITRGNPDPYESDIVYDVVDAEGKGTIDGFDFERLG